MNTQSPRVSQALRARTFARMACSAEDRGDARDNGWNTDRAQELFALAAAETTTNR